MYSFDVVTCADAVDGIGMTKVVYPRIGKTDALYDALEAVEDRTVGDIAPELIGEHQAAVFPRGACQQSLCGLLRFLSLQ